MIRELSAEGEAQVRAAVREELAEVLAAVAVRLTDGEDPASAVRAAVAWLTSPAQRPARAKAARHNDNPG